MQKTTVESLDRIYTILAAIKEDLDDIASASDLGLPVPTAEDEGKFLSVDDEGKWVLVTAPDNTTPSDEDPPST